MDGLTEAVEWTFVSEGEVVGLGLEADFDCVEGVFDVFAYYAGDLRGVSGWEREGGRRGESVPSRR